MIGSFLAKYAIGRTLQKVPWQVWALVALIAVGVYIDHRAFKRGFADADAKWIAAVEQEVGRQRDVNAEAQEWARAEVARLMEAKEERDAILEELDKAAAADPDGGNMCLGPDSVHRLNISD